MPKLKNCMSSISKRHLQRLAKVEKGRASNRHVITHLPESTIPNFTCNEIEDDSNNYVDSNDPPFPIADSCCSFEPVSSVTDNNYYEQQFDDSNSFCGVLASMESHDSFLEEARNNAAETDSYSRRSLGSELRSWASEACVRQKHLSSLLKILRRHGFDKELPSDARTLLKTPRSVELIEMHPRKYYHFGLCEGLKRSILSNYSLENIADKIKINTHVDGLPLSKSSGTQLWPILVSIDDSFLYTNPFIVGAYVGNSKPSDSNDFLSYYVEDVKNVSATGLSIEGKKVSVDIHLFIGDAPAMSYVKCTKAFNARHGCGKCEVEGDFVKNRMTFPDLNAPLRTDESFAHKTDEDYHKKTSILETLNVRLVSAFPSESQHLVYQGVVKKITQFAVKGEQGVRMNQASIESASAHLFTLRKTIPKEFARKPRPLQEVDRYKATEFRQLLLYTGPVIFEGRLDNDEYNHFLSLIVAIRILSSAEFHVKLNDYARNLLRYFVENYGALYGVEHVTFNVHNLIHLSDDVLRLGPLDSFSSLKYENHLQKLKKQIKTSGKELQQLANRTKEQYSHQIIENFVHKQYPIIKFNGHIEGEKHFIKSLEYDSYVCSLKQNNNCIYTRDGSIISIQSMYRENQTVHISGKKYVGPTAMFKIPCDSTILNIRLVAENRFSLVTLLASEIKQKCVKLPLNDRHKSAVFPLIHED